MSVACGQWRIPKFTWYTMLYYMIIYVWLLYYTTAFHDILNYSGMCCTTDYVTVIYHRVLYHPIQNCIIPYMCMCYYTQAHSPILCSTIPQSSDFNVEHRIYIHVNLYWLPIDYTDFPPFKLLSDIYIQWHRFFFLNLPFVAMRKSHMNTHYSK